MRTCADRPKPRRQRKVRYGDCPVSASTAGTGHSNRGYMPIPYIAILKGVYDAVKQAIGIVEKVQDHYKETVVVNAETLLYRPGKDEVVERILLGKFPAIPGRYRMRVEGGEEQIVDLRATVDERELKITWKYRELGDGTWWLLTEPIIQSIHWIELIEIYYE